MLVAMNFMKTENSKDENKVYLFLYSPEIATIQFLAYPFIFYLSFIYLSFLFKYTHII